MADLQPVAVRKIWKHLIKGSLKKLRKAISQVLIFCSSTHQYISCTYREKEPPSGGFFIDISEKDYKEFFPMRCRMPGKMNPATSAGGRMLLQPCCLLNYNR